MIGRRDGAPIPPVNLVGDFGGGGMLLAVGVLAGIVQARDTGTGQVVDAAMVDGSALLASMIYGFKAMGLWDGGRGANMLDTGSHYYDVYETADGKYITLGGIEPQFYAEMLERLGFDEGDFDAQHDANQWPAYSEKIAARVREKTRAEWDEVFVDSDACYAPVLDMEEAPTHPHNAERETFINVAGVTQPAPAPRFSATPTATPAPPAHAGQHTDEVLADWGFAEDEIAELRASEAIA